MRVGYLGPRGTYAELAARTEFGEEAEMIAYPLISDVAEAVARGDIEIGVIPIESLREGSIGEALDSLAWTDVKIRAEVVLPISHSLLGVTKAKLENITQILSHPQALAQCREFLRENLPNAELVEVASTAKAAERISKLKKPSIAAIGPKALAELYGLEVLREGIQTGDVNITRFFCLAKEDSRPTGNDKTSIVFYTAEDRPGILYEILREFAIRNINLTKIESRPSKKALGDYLFFIDFEGHREDGKVAEALEGVKRKTAMLKILGSYPERFKRSR